MKNKLSLILVIILLFAIYRPWLDFTKTLSSGDWTYLYKENIAEFKIPPKPPYLWVNPYYQITAKIGVQGLNIPWEATEKIFWFYPFLILSFLSSYKFVGFFLKKFGVDKHLDFLTAFGVFIFMANTYVLMLVGGGQMGVAMSYALSPLVIYMLAKAMFEKTSLWKFIATSFILAIQIMFDPRIFFLTIVAFILYTTYQILLNKEFDFGKLKVLLAVLLLAVFANSFWFLPSLSFYSNVYSEIAKEPSAGFLSFATFPNSISLLHPNWPDNIFGKIGFMKPEFIIIAILAYVSLLVVGLKNKVFKTNILYFIFLGLLGAFFAKGVNPPFGFIYDAFSKLPLSSVFRDPTKFYLWIVLCYSLLIPLSVFFMSGYLSKFKKGKYLSLVFILLVISYFVFLIKPAIDGQLRGTFHPTSLPPDYVKLENFLVSQRGPFNSLWMPTTQRFSLSLEEKAAIGAEDFLGSTSPASASAMLGDQKTHEEIINSNIKYVIISYDSLGEIFLEDRKYSENLHTEIVNDLEKIKWLSLLKNSDGKSRFGKIFVFEVIK